MKIQNNTANLINPLPPQLYNDYRQWYYRSSLFIVILLSILLSYTCYQYWQLHTFKRQTIPMLHGSINISPAEIVALQKRYDSLQEYSKYIAQIEAKKSSFNTLFFSLIALMPEEVCLMSFEYAHERFNEIMGQAQSLAAITQLWQRLQENPAFCTLQLTKIQPSLDTEHKEYSTFVLQQ